MHRFLIVGLIVALFFLPVMAIAKDDVNHNYIKVEIRGALETGLIAIGGETTGTAIRVNNVTWELDFGGNTEFRALAKRLHGKIVLVTGTYQKIKGDK